MKLTIHVEKICCDECEAVHIHFDCPACHEEYAGTDCYTPRYDWENNQQITCEHCGVVFEVMDNRNSDPDEWEWKRVGPVQRMMFIADGHFVVRGRGTVYTGRNPEDTDDFKNLIGKDVEVHFSGGIVTGVVAAVERFAHCPPWKAGEPIGILLEEAP